MTDTILRPTLAYLLRLWAERDGRQWQWRASLHPISGGSPTAFGTFDEAFQFLREKMKQTEIYDHTSPSDEGNSIPLDKE